MTIHRKGIKSVKYQIVDRKNKLNKEILEKRNLLRTHEYEDNLLLYNFRRYNDNKHSSNKKGYLAYQKLCRFNTKILKLCDKFKDTFGITVGTDHPHCAEPSDPIIKCANFNRGPIQNFTSIYQIKLCTVSSALIISRRPFSFIKVSRSSDTIDYLLFNQCEVFLSDEDTDKANGPQFIWPAFIGVFYTAETS